MHDSNIHLESNYKQWRNKTLKNEDQGQEGGQDKILRGQDILANCLEMRV